MSKAKRKSSNATHEFVIDRKKWIRGSSLKEEPEEKYVITPCSSYLKDRSGSMCCLGFYLESLGAKGLTGKQLPITVRKLPEEASWLVTPMNSPTNQCIRLVNANDRDSSCHKERETAVSDLFAEKGIKVKFVGKYP